MSHICALSSGIRLENFSKYENTQVYPVVDTQCEEWNRLRLWLPPLETSQVSEERERERERAREREREREREGEGERGRDSMIS